MLQQCSNSGTTTRHKDGRAGEPLVREPCSSELLRTIQNLQEACSTQTHRRGELKLVLEDVGKLLNFMHNLVQNEGTGNTHPHSQAQVPTIPKSGKRHTSCPRGFSALRQKRSKDVNRSHADSLHSIASLRSKMGSWVSNLFPRRLRTPAQSADRSNSARRHETRKVRKHSLKPLLSVDEQTMEQSIFEEVNSIKCYNTFYLPNGRFQGENADFAFNRWSESPHIFLGNNENFGGSRRSKNMGKKESVEENDSEATKPDDEPPEANQRRKSRKSLKKLREKSVSQEDETDAKSSKAKKPGDVRQVVIENFDITQKPPRDEEMLAKSTAANAGTSGESQRRSVSKRRRSQHKAENEEDKHEEAFVLDAKDGTEHQPEKKKHKHHKDTSKSAEATIMKDSGKEFDDEHQTDRRKSKLVQNYTIQELSVNDGQRDDRDESTRKQRRHSSHAHPPDESESRRSSKYSLRNADAKDDIDRSAGRRRSRRSSRRDRLYSQGSTELESDDELRGRFGDYYSDKKLRRPRKSRSRMRLRRRFSDFSEHQETSDDSEEDDYQYRTRSRYGRYGSVPNINDQRDDSDDAGAYSRERSRRSMSKRCSYACHCGSAPSKRHHQESSQSQADGELMDVLSEMCSELGSRLYSEACCRARETRPHRERDAHLGRYLSLDTLRLLDGSDKQRSNRRACDHQFTPRLPPRAPRRRDSGLECEKQQCNCPPMGRPADIQMKAAPTATVVQPTPVYYPVPQPVPIAVQQPPQTTQSWYPPPIAPPVSTPTTPSSTNVFMRPSPLSVVTPSPVTSTPTVYNPLMVPSMHSPAVQSSMLYPTLTYCQRL
ncbi:hypothetical protein CRM22_010691 [Opisthorchis felineus]|uniref:Uncharacterized protein n=1 Tax=Opisthorchis felineus TaxID=147828 RepID=A0A4S2KQP3_OPIFE|nr:hypothetical protein CRM22_010691 [Opisthorchis felineus]